MDNKSEIRTGQADGKRLKGLQNNGLIEIKCADCGAKLLQLQLTTIENKQAQVLTRIVVKCELCGGFSYVQQIPGQFYPGAPSNDMAFDVINDDIGAPEADVLFKAWKKSK